MMGGRIRLLGLLAACLTAATVVSGGNAAAAVRARSFSVALSPSPGDVTLLQVRFPRARSATIGPHSLRVAVHGSFGADYLAIAAPRHRGRASRQVLVVLANRPSALLDPVSVHLRLIAVGTLGAPVLRHLTNVLSGDDTRPPVGLCSLTAVGRPLAPASLRPLGTRGAAVAGFGMAAAVAAGYDGACGSPSTSQAFRSALVGEAGGSSGSDGGCTTGACEPAPVPPSPGPPRCAPCDPQPGFACPLVALAAVCVASSSTVEER
jgi:hypothetical protein